MSEPLEYDWPSRDDERRRAFEPERLVQDRRGTYIPRRQRRPAIGFGSCLLIVSVLAIVLLRFAWAPMLMAFAILGITDVKTMAAVVIVAVILGAAALRERLSGRRF